MNNEGIKLSILFLKKDVLIKELVHESRKFESESSSKLKENDTVRSRNSAESARLNEKNKEQFEKLKIAESEITKLKYELENANLLIIKLQEDNTKLEQEANDNENDSEAKRIKNFRELELDKVRTKLQQRLNDLEPLPELLKNTELKLHEALKKQKDNETHNIEQEKVINSLNAKIEKLENLISEKENALNNLKNNNHYHHDTEVKQNKNDFDSILSERKIKSLEEENHELFRQLTIKDEALRDLNVN